MRIAYLTPLHPNKSGISDYAELIIPALGKECDIDVFTLPNKIDNREIAEAFKVYPVKEFYKKHQEYDFCIYQAGNNTEFHKEIMEAFMKFGGILEMHDLAMPHYVAADTIGRNLPEEYLRIMEYCHGEIGRERAIAYFQGRKTSSWDSEPLKYMTNKHFIDNAQAVIVHSDFAKQIVHTINPNVPIGYVPLPAFRFVDNSKQYMEVCRNELDVPMDEFIIGSFGFATPSKRIKEILHALARLKEEKYLFRYYIVGKLVDKTIINLIRELQLEQDIVITGFVDDEMFYKYLGICNLVASLRYPTMGESSGPLNKALGMGKRVMVTDIGTFSEYPEDVVHKISYGDTEVDDIYKSIIEAINSEDDEHSKAVLQYAKKNLSTECAIEHYMCLMRQLQEENYEHNYEDIILDRLFEMNMLESQYIEKICDDITECLQVGAVDCY